MSSLTTTITSLQDLIYRYEATSFRIQSITVGAPLPMHSETTSARLFEFGNNTATAAYLTQSNPEKIELLYAQLNAIDLPSQTEFNTLASIAQETYSGIRRFIQKYTPEAKEAQRYIESINIKDIEQKLDSLDAQVHMDKFGNYSLSIDPQQVAQDISTATGETPKYVDPEVLIPHIHAVTHYMENKATSDALETKIRDTARELQFKLATPLLNSTEIEILNTISSTPLRLAPLQGMTIQGIANAEVSDLINKDGIGQVTAQKAIAAARSYRNELINSQKPHINFSDKTPEDYVVALSNFITYQDQLRSLPQPTFPLTGMSSSSVYFTTGSVTWLDSLPKLPEPHNTPEQAWAMYQTRAAEFNSYHPGNSDGQSTVPTEVAEKIAHTTLNGTLHATLRGYQDFGSKFALVQKHTLIGDEMGLGKTMQALALIAHVGGRSLVVCPASLRLNWEREIQKFTDTPSYVLYGPNKDALYAQWQQDGGVAIAGFAEIRNNPLYSSPPHPLDVFVVDEAHRAKNQGSLQAQGVRDISAIAEYVLFLTGTPLENKVSEFATLINYLDPNLKLGDQDNHPNPQKFKEAISGIYLRRNQADVLDELPPLVEVEEWVEPNKTDSQEYKKAVQAGHFMHMRKANFGPESAKMERLIQLTEDGTGKTIVFTFFTSVLNDIMSALGSRAYGPISGKVPHKQRQKNVDDFTAAPEGAVLVCQVKAASEGLNIQAANRVIFCEPQLNPQTEAQAIARAYRMGQINTVEVHRLLTPKSIDERLMGILDSKRVLFEDFARESEVAVRTPEAYDTTNKTMIEQLISEERQKYGVPTDTPLADTDPSSREDD